MTSVTFRVDLVLDGKLVTLDEAQLPGDGPAQAAQLASEIVGAIVIDTAEGSLAVADDLTAAAINLCFRGPTAILDEPHGHFLYRASLATSHVVMVPLADDIRIFGEQTPVVTVDRATLLPTLYRCGLRVIELLDHVGDPAEAALTADDLRAAAADTAAALHRHGLTG